ncbi:MAG: hypothetical protein RQ899_10265 [Pseudomonadales bacterium]|nr:hypothetical protein [Pseudomonadales bacterium]
MKRPSCFPNILKIGPPAYLYALFMFSVGTVVFSQEASEEAKKIAKNYVIRESGLRQPENFSAGRAFGYFLRVLNSYEYYFSKEDYDLLTLETKNQDRFSKELYEKSTNEWRYICADYILNPGEINPDDFSDSLAKWEISHNGIYEKRMKDIVAGLSVDGAILVMEKLIPEIISKTNSTRTDVVSLAKNHPWIVQDMYQSSCNSLKDIDMGVKTKPETVDIRTMSESGDYEIQITTE